MTFWDRMFCVDHQLQVNNKLFPRNSSIDLQQAKFLTSTSTSLILLALQHPDRMDPRTHRHKKVNRLCCNLDDSTEDI